MEGILWESERARFSDRPCVFVVPIPGKISSRFGCKGDLRICFETRTRDIVNVRERRERKREKESGVEKKFANERTAVAFRFSRILIGPAYVVGPRKTWHTLAHRPSHYRSFRIDRFQVSARYTRINFVPVPLRLDAASFKFDRRY